MAISISISMSSMGMSSNRFKALTWEVTWSHVTHNEARETNPNRSSLRYAFLQQVALRSQFIFSIFSVRTYTSEGAPMLKWCWPMAQGGAANRHRSPTYCMRRLSALNQGSKVYTYSCFSDFDLLFYYVQG
jgi:hypothetical protein